MDSQCALVENDPGETLLLIVIDRAELIVMIQQLSMLMIVGLLTFRRIDSQMFSKTQNIIFMQTTRTAGEPAC